MFKNYLTTVLKYFLGFLILTIACLYLTASFRTPSNQRDWATDQAILPVANIEGNKIEVKNIRNFSYQSRDEYTPSYYDQTFYLDKLESVDYIVEPLADYAAAHTFLSFGFSDDSQLAISVEIRKEKGEEFSPFSGLLNNYELMYIAADEHDVLTLRAIHRDNPVYLYPIKANKENIQKLFISMLNRMNSVAKNPEFYNTLTNSCTTNIVEHINEISGEKIGWDYRIVMPLDSDKLAYELGFLDDTLPFSELREKHNIQEIIKNEAGSEDFSQNIRKNLFTNGTDQ